jgi:hypothetical protein
MSSSLSPGHPARAARRVAGKTDEEDTELPTVLVPLGTAPNDLTSLDHFAERFAVGVFTEKAWVENVYRITR